MSMSAWKVGTAWQAYVDYSTASLLNTDWTKTVTKDGASAANTGVTVTYVAGTTYSVTGNATTSFVAGTGTYDVVVQRTTIPGDVFSESIRVTSDGTFAGTSGGVSFTPTAANGRITDGASALQGATVTITRSSGAIYVQLTSDANGLWSTVYFDANGTFTITAQKSGYTVGTGTVVISGGTTATGPGSDIALTAAAASSSVSAAALWGFGRRCFRGRTGITADLEIKQAVDDALGMVSMERDCPWLHTLGRINFVAPYTTGTVAIAAGSAVLTLTGGTFPTWAASGEILIQNQWQTILTRDSATQLTLDNAWATATVTAEGYTLAQSEYTLPSDCMKVDQIVQSVNIALQANPTSRAKVEVAKIFWQSGQTYPAYWAIERDRLVLWPYPSIAAMCNLLYFKRPAALTLDTDIADWDPNQLEVLRRAIEYQIAIRGECVAGTKEQCYAAYKDALGRAISNDRTAANRQAGISMRRVDDLRTGITITP